MRSFALFILFTLLWRGSASAVMRHMWYADPAISGGFPDCMRTALSLVPEEIPHLDVEFYKKRRFGNSLPYTLNRELGMVGWRNFCGQRWTDNSGWPLPNLFRGRLNFSDLWLISGSILQLRALLR